jgi:hypothetical protein
MMLLRLLATSALIVALAVPGYCSDDFNPLKDTERAGGLKDTRLTKKGRSETEAAELVIVNNNLQANNQLVIAEDLLAILNSNAPISADQFQAVTKLAVQGHERATYKLGMAYASGAVITENPSLVISSILTAAANGETQSRKAMKDVFRYKPKGHWSLPHQSRSSLVVCATRLFQEANEIASHFQQCGITNDTSKPYEEARFAIPQLKAHYDLLLGKVNRLGTVLEALTKTTQGFMVSCLNHKNQVSGPLLTAYYLDYGKPSEQLHQYSLNFYRDEASREYTTFGRLNVEILYKVVPYLKKQMSSDLDEARRVMGTMVQQLYPSYAALHAAQQAYFSAKRELATLGNTEHSQQENEEAEARLVAADLRFQQEKVDYDELQAINQTEIDSLQRFTAKLTEIETQMKVLLLSTEEARNKEFIENPMYSYLKK